ncbi:MAG: toll/interleukin-1 receptor domain-containing protein [Anaerolineae bacterium]|nr:toll/interleukin-1 receptor domain-containing protein [Anaerolineae bacterium]
MTAITIFVSYSRKDELEKEMLLAHLKLLHHNAGFEVWSDDQIQPGRPWQQEIQTAMKRAKIAVLLITINFLNSEFILREEIPTLLKRREQEGLEIVPVLARACAWPQVAWLAGMNVRPRDGRPVWAESGHKVDEELSKIADEIAGMIGRIRLNERQSDGTKGSSKTPTDKKGAAVMHNLSTIIHGFNEGCTSYHKALGALKDGLMSDYENGLNVAVRQIVNVLELTLKTYLESICEGEVWAKDGKVIKKPNFYRLTEGMEHYANPKPDPDLIKRLHSYRQLRNPAEHNASIPPLKPLTEAIETTRLMMLTYLPVEATQLKECKAIESVNPLVDSLEEVITALKAGDKPKARHLLAELLKRNPKNETVWMWLLEVTDTDAQKQDCLQQVLKINPNNETAKKLLVKINSEVVHGSKLTAGRDIVGRNSNQEIVHGQKITGEGNQTFGGHNEGIQGSNMSVDGNVVTGKRNIGGNVDTGGGSVVFGNQVVQAAPEEPSISELVERADKLLGMKDYANAVKACEQALIQAPENSQANLLAAIALFHGRGADRLRDNVVARIEEHLKPALDEPATEATALAIIGIVKYDHYIANGLFAGKPTIKEINQKLEAIGRDEIDHKLLRWVKASSAAMERVGLSDSGAV